MFVERWQSKLVLNVHSLYHVVDFVRLHGPL